jgi:F0F1-type ATP synthase epsilon subunit
MSSVACRWVVVAGGFVEVAMTMMGLATEAYARSVDVRARAYEAAVRARADELAELRHQLRVEQIILERLERQRVAAGQVAA